MEGKSFKFETSRSKIFTYFSAIFTAIGANFLNIINGSLYIAATVFWLAAWKWLEPYK